MKKERFFLLIEDDQTDIHIFQRAHQKLGLNHPVVIADDAHKAMQILRKTDRSHEALIILDIKMPCMDGFAFLRQLRHSTEHHSHCIFVLSSSDNESDIAQAYDLGASGYFVKNQAFEKTLASLKLMDDFIHLVELPAFRQESEAL